jgi:hypothetical protein
MDSVLKGRLILGAIATVVLLAALVMVWLERRHESDIMRKRINAGSDQFLEERGSIWHEAVKEARSFFGPRV